MVRGIAVIVVSIIHFTIGHAAFSQFPFSPSPESSKERCEQVKTGIRRTKLSLLGKTSAVINAYAFTVEEPGLID